MNSQSGLTHISIPLGEVLKEVLCRAELRHRLEAELGGPLTDEEFMAIAERTGVKI